MKNVLKTAVWHQRVFREIPPAMTENAAETWQRDRSTRAVFTWGHSPGTRSLWQTRAAFSDEAIVFRYTADTDSSRAYTAIIGSEYSKMAGKRLSWKTGGNVLRQWARADGYSDGARWFGQTRLAAYAMSEWTWNGGRISGLLRQEWVQDQAAPFTWSLGGHTEAGRVGAFRFHISRNFNLPTFNDRYWRSFGKPELQPEKGYGADVGWVFNRSSFSTKLTVFQLLIDDWILWQPGPDGIFKPDNLRKVWSRGLETSVCWNWAKGAWKGKVSGRYQYVKATNTAVYGGLEDVLHKQLLYTPNHNAGLVIQVANGAFSGVYLHQLTGKRFTTTDNSGRPAGFLHGKPAAPLYIFPPTLAGKNRAGGRRSATQEFGRPGLSFGKYLEYPVPGDRIPADARPELATGVCICLVGLFTFAGMERKTETLIYTVLSAAFGVYIILRAEMLPITVDESTTAVIHVQRTVLDTLTYSTEANPNNHILNTLLIKLFTGLFGWWPVVVRLPVLIGGFLYLWAANMLSKRFSEQSRVRLFAFVALLGNPYVLEFFALARGYGLGAGLMLVALWQTWLFLEENSDRRMRNAVLAAGLAVYANFTLVLFFAPFMALLLIANWQLNPSGTEFWRRSRSTIPVLAAFFGLWYLPLSRLSQHPEMNFFTNIGTLVEAVQDSVKAATHSSPYFGDDTVQILTWATILFSILSGGQRYGAGYGRVFNSLPTLGCFWLPCFRERSSPILSSCNWLIPTTFRRAWRFFTTRFLPFNWVWRLPGSSSDGRKRCGPRWLPLCCLFRSICSAMSTSGSLRNGGSTPGLIS
ncbi:MAG: TonB-dependent receptor [Lewinellaceae bacterium]|nr:TonB-dependent receptor [Lewinellaceae bacterium]